MSQGCSTVRRCSGSAWKDWAPGLHPASQEWCFPSFPSTSPPPSRVLQEPSALPFASICFKLLTTMLGPEWTRKVSQIYCNFKLSLKLPRHCWNISSSFKTLQRLCKQREGPEDRQQEMSGASWPCWGHGKGALGVPEVMLSPGQCPLGQAGTDGAERPLNPHSAPAPAREQPRPEGLWLGQDHPAQLKAHQRQPLAVPELPTQSWLFPGQELGCVGWLCWQGDIAATSICCLPHHRIWFGLGDRKSVV